jgi:AraC-like DNA-binding protein
LREIELLLDSGQARQITGAGNHWHYHVEMELTLFTSGEGTRFAGDNISPFAAGEVVLLGEKLPHHWHTRGPSSGLSVQWSFPPEHPFWSFPEALLLVPVFKRAGHGILYHGAIAAAITEGMREIVHSTGLERLGVLLRLMSIVARASETEQVTLSHRSFSLPTESRHQEAMSEAVRHLLAHFRDEIRLEEVLKLTQMSKPAFSRQFKKHSGKTFSEFLSCLRLQAACRELVETDRSVLEIALSCGYNQISFFNRIFRRTLGCSPSQYRARERRN